MSFIEFFSCFLSCLQSNRKPLDLCVLLHLFFSLFKTNREFFHLHSYIRENGVDNLFWEASEIRIFINNSQYDTNIDIFSYGILLIHIFSAGKWPFPTKAVTVYPNDPDKLSPVSEAKHRQQYLDDITSDHPLMDLY